AVSFLWPSWPRLLRSTGLSLPYSLLPMVSFTSCRGVALTTLLAMGSLLMTRLSSRNIRKPFFAI
ncbi:hypothetical protein FOZ62_028702, partial [Perkinsus olseni]